jgi:hypothetical protein
MVDEQFTEEQKKIMDLYYKIHVNPDAHYGRSGNTFDRNWATISQAMVPYLKEAYEKYGKDDFLAKDIRDQKYILCTETDITGRKAHFDQLRAEEAKKQDPSHHKPPGGGRGR